MIQCQLNQPQRSFASSRRFGHMASSSCARARSLSCRLLTGCRWSGILKISSGEWQVLGHLRLGAYGCNFYLTAWKSWGPMWCSSLHFTSLTFKSKRSSPAVGVGGCGWGGTSQRAMRRGGRRGSARVRALRPPPHRRSVCRHAARRHAALQARGNQQPSSSRTLCFWNLTPLSPLVRCWNRKRRLCALDYRLQLLLATIACSAPFQKR